MLQLIFKKLDPKFAVSFAFLLILQQALSSFSLYLLTELTNVSTNEQVLLTYISLFFLLMIFESALVIPIRYVETKGFYQSYKKWLDSKFEFISGKTYFWINKDKKTNFSTAITFKMYLAISGIIVSSFDILKYLMSLFFSGILLVSIFGSKFIIIFAISAFLSSAFYLLTKNRIVEKTKINQKNEVNFFSYLSKSWDNLILGNKENEKLFSMRKSKLGEDFLKSNINVFLTSEKIVFFSFLIAILPIAVFNIYFIKENYKNMPLLMSTLILIPRQITLLNGLRAIIQLLTFLKLDLESYNSLNEESKLESIELNSLIDYSKITVNEKTFQSFDDLSSYISNSKKGRFTIRGTNGAGKTALLLLLKFTHKDSFYLPASPDLEIQINSQNKSTGQILKSNFDFIISDVDASLLLLDEWDANLDKSSKAEYSEIINQISAKRTVVEVLH